MNGSLGARLGVAPSITTHIVAINPAEVVATTNFNLDAGR